MKGIKKLYHNVHARPIPEPGIEVRPCEKPSVCVFRAFGGGMCQFVVCGRRRCTEPLKDSRTIPFHSVHLAMIAPTNCIALQVIIYSTRLQQYSESQGIPKEPAS